MLARLDTLFVRGKQRIRLPAQCGIGRQAPVKKAARSNWQQNARRAKECFKTAFLVE
jgi:hypothetical protein